MTLIAMLSRAWFFWGIFIIALSFVAFQSAWTNAKNRAALDSFKVNVKGAGHPVILIPGLMSDERIWRDIAEHLALRYQVHTLSLAGFAGLPPIAEPSLANVKKDLLAYMKKENLIKPALIGHSLGGFFAMSLAIDASGEFGPVVSVDGLPFIGPIFTQSNATSVESLSAQAIQMKQFFAQLSPQELKEQASMGITRQATSPQNQALVIEMAGKSDPTTVSDMMYALMSTDLRSELNRIKQPLLVIGASGAIPAASQAYVQSLYAEALAAKPEARLVMNRESHHFVMLDQPEWLLKILIEFLEEAAQ